jgi:hypothetical protein
LEGAGVSAAEALNAARAVGVSVQLDGGELVLEAAIGGRKLLALTTDMAVISNSSGANLTFYRRWHETGDVLAWELIPHA